jgi:hypothetical protein
MGSQGVSPKPDPEPVEPSNDGAVKQPSARSRKVNHKNPPKSPKPGKKELGEVWVRGAENAIEVASMIIDGSFGVVGHLMTRAIPETPTKGLPFVAVLAILTLIIGNREAHAEPLCFGCLGLLGVVAVCLVIIAVKNPGTDARLSQMQDERASAIKVKPLQY